ncbi:MAG: hypothetical protein AB7N70_01295 [Dehalococcoidia bacterium]
MCESFDDCIRDVEAAYKRLGHTMGWRFLTSPRATLSPKTRIALITLNPGGDREPPEHPRASSDAGSSYCVETWPGHAEGGAPLQRQVQSLCRGLQRHLNDDQPLPQFMATAVLSAHFIPFRSPSFDALHNRQASIKFGRDLWTRILNQWRPRLILTIDRESCSVLHGILMANAGTRVTSTQQFQTG